MGSRTLGPLGSAGRALLRVPQPSNAPRRNRSPAFRFWQHEHERRETSYYSADACGESSLSLDVSMSAGFVPIAYPAFRMLISIVCGTILTFLLCVYDYRARAHLARPPRKLVCPIPPGSDYEPARWILARNVPYPGALT
ncbi:hypothetical protein AcV7_009816 [Taiwanofungus camphoratus]|nr:hypothetical protein AcV7_009816 [Antrodia cinnamomea]